jgi:hypothetical protein
MQLQHHYFFKEDASSNFVIQFMIRSDFKLQKMKLLSLTSLFSISIANSFAQMSAKTITGFIKDIQNEAVAGATITLYNNSDSALFQRKVASNQGKFQFTDLSDGIYFLKVSAAGSRDYNSVKLLIDGSHKTVSLPAIILLPVKNTQLKEVVVTARRPLIEQDIDKTIVNVDAMISAATSNSLEVLEKTPGVTVDINGNISLNGVSGVLVLIDGRQTYMSGQELANYLKSLPGGLLDKIELITNPPAKYDAAGSAIINIRLKKNRSGGYAGNFVSSYSQGRTGRLTNVINMNYSARKINLLANFGHYIDGNYFDETYDRRLFDVTGGVNSSQQNTNNAKTRSKGIFSKVGMDYSISPKTIIGFNANILTRPRNDIGEYFNNYFNANNVLDTVAKGASFGNNNWLQLTGNLNFQHKFNEQGKELGVDINIISYASKTNQTLPNSVYSGDGRFVRSYEYLYKLPSNKTIYNTKIDYSLPLKNKFRIDLGAKSSFVKNDNTAEYYNVYAGTNTPDFDKSNHFIYKENINALYVSMRKNFKTLGIQAGLRFENTNINGNQSGNLQIRGSSFKRGYSGIYPTLFLNYQLGSKGKNTLGLSYAKRVGRPNYQQLNPFLIYKDKFTYTTGNPLLDAAQYYQAEFAYSYKQLLRISLQYNKQIKNIFDATSVANNIFIVKPENLGRREMLALNAFLNFKPMPWWNATFNLGVAHFAAAGYVDSQKVNLESYGGRFMFNNQCQFKKGWSAELSGNYTTRQISSQSIMEPIYRMNMAVGKKIWKNKGSVKLSLEDIGHFWVIKQSLVSLKQAEVTYKYLQDTERIGVAFTYNFGKEIFNRKRRYNDNAADDVKGRVE